MLYRKYFTGCSIFYIRKFFWYFVFLTIFFSVNFPIYKLYAVPACPSPFELKQPTGKTFEARKRGDEWYNWVETKDGYGIYKNTDTGYWEYYVPSDETPKKEQKFRTGRKQDAKKRAIVSEVDPATLGIPKGLRPPRKEDSRPWKPTKPKTSPQITPHPSPLPQGERESSSAHESKLGKANDSPLERGVGGVSERSKKQPPESPFDKGDLRRFRTTESSTSTAVSGTMHLLVIGVDYDDCPATYSASQIQSLAFGSSNSVADYYNNVSYGAVTIKPATESSGTANDGFIGWLRLSGKHPYYSDSIWALFYLLRDAVIAADPYIDYSSYDTDGNGIIEPTELSIVVIVAGYEQSSSGLDVPSVWGEYLGGFPSDGDNVTIYDYVVVGEKHGDHLATIGTMCHEVGHLMFWLPDLYGEGGLGYFDLMANGNWGAKDGEYAGSSPTQLSAWSKEYLGWGTINVVSSNQTVSFPKSDGNKSSIFRMNTSEPDQYFLIENREFSGYDIGFQNQTDISGHGGLVIYHVDNSVKWNEEYNNRRVDVEEANGRDTALYPAETNMFFFLGNNSSFTDTTTPNSKLKNGDSTYISITNISPYGNTMTSSILRPPIAVTGLVTNLTSNSATLNGTVNSYGQRVTVWCEYGTESKLYNNKTSTQTISDSLDTAVSFYIDNLSDKTTYYYRIVAQAGSEKICGKEANFVHLKTTPKLIGAGIYSSFSTPYSSSHSLALKSDGTVYTWGYNGEYQLGDGTTEDKTTPVNVLNGVTDIAAAETCNFALKPDNTVWGWGSSYSTGNGYYAYLGSEYSEAATPVLLRNLSESRTIACGKSHTLALKSDGTVWTWGYNIYGQLGNGTFTNSTVYTPIQVSGIRGVLSIAAGGNIAVDSCGHSLALKSDGTVWAWGYNGYGQLGDGTIENKNVPVQVIGLSGIVAIASGDYHNLALKSDGTVWAWGYNGYGQLGDGTTEEKIPVQVSGLNNVIAISGGAHHSLAVKSDGTVWAWGENTYGQLGNGTFTSSNVYTPIQVSGIGSITAIAAGATHSLAQQSDGTVWAWGSNYYGQLGDGTTEDKNTPTQVKNINLGETSADAIVPSGSISINNGDSSANFTSVTLNLAATDAFGVTGYYVSTSSACPSDSDTNWTPVSSAAFYSENISYTLGDGEGTKTVYAWYKDEAGNISGTAYDSIILQTGTSTPTPTTTPLPELTPPPLPTPATTVTPSGICEEESMEVSTTKLVLRKGQSVEITVSVKGAGDCPVEGITVTASVSSKRISVSPIKQETDENGEATLTITAKNMIGITNITFRAGNLKKTLRVRVKKWQT